MARTMTKSQRTPLLPAGAKEFLVKRTIELCGLFLGTCAIILALTLASYTPGDPSWNSASPHDVQNIMGPIGAYIADIMVQSFGLACVVPVLVLFSWAWRITSKQMVSNLWMRLIILCSAAFLLAIAFNAVPTPDTWPLRSGLGGVGGMILTQRLISFLSWIGVPNLALIELGIALFCGISGILSLLYGLALSRSEWTQVGQGVGSVAKGTLQGSVVAVRKGVGVLQRTKLEDMIEEESGIEDEEPVLKRKRSAKKIKEPEEEISLPKKSQKPNNKPLSFRQTVTTSRLLIS